MADARQILLGRIVGAHGVRGWVRVESHTRPRQNIFQYQPWILCHRGLEQSIDAVRGQGAGQRLIAHWPGLEDRNQAEALIGAEIRVPRSSLPPAAADEYYWVDLEGLRVVGADGFDFGRIDQMLATGSNDVMAVRGERERLIPFIQGDVVKRVDLEAGWVEVDWDPEF